METKICIYCNLEKNINDFDKKKKYYLKYCKECRKEKRKEYYQKNKQKEMTKSLEYYYNNKEKIKNVKKEYREKNRNKLIEYNKKWEALNKEKRKVYDNNYKKEKKKNDCKYKLICQTRSMINETFKRKKYFKSNKCEKILGCNYIDFINYLLNTYKKNYGIEWDGKDKVHIDHIIPLSTAKTEEEVIKLCNYTNLQLLKAKDNLHKSNKLNWELKS